MDLSPGISYFFGQLGKAFLAPGSQISLASLFTALFIAFLVLAVRRYKKGRRIRLRLLVRALFPKRIVLNRSSFADLGYFYFNLFVFGLVLGWAVLSYDMISRAVVDLLAAAFGPVQPTSLPVFVSRTIITVMLFLAYELGYWLNHYLSHRIPFLWEFHKVHHSATVLTPLTNFRVHPVYMCIFSNILAVVTGLANGLGDYLLGAERAAIRPVGNQYHPRLLHLLLRSLAAYAAVDLIHRLAGPSVDEPRASSNSSLAQSGPLQQKSGKLSGGVGLDVRHPVYSRAAFAKSLNSASSRIVSTRTRSGAN